MIPKHKISNVKFKQINFCFDVSHCQTLLPENRGPGELQGMITSTVIHRTKAYFQQRLHRDREWQETTSFTGPKPAEETGLVCRYAASTPPVLWPAVRGQKRLLCDYRCPHQADLNESVSSFSSYSFLIPPLPPFLPPPTSPCRHHVLHYHHHHHPCHPNHHCHEFK